MITIHEENCIGCGLCAKVCHNRCVALVDDVPRVDEQLCDRCTQCVAICPQQALSWNGVPPAVHDSARLPAPEQLDELFKARLAKDSGTPVSELTSLWEPPGHQFVREFTADKPLRI